jgi:rhomboid protease GluP
VKKAFPFVSLILAMSTLAASFTVATVVKGSPWSVVRILELRNYGGVDNAHLANGEWWRLLTSQFVHVKPAHMLLNVIMLFLLALCVERAAGALRLTLLWLLSGIAGTYASIHSVPPPYDIGSGASQAIMGVAGAAVVVVWRNLSYPQWLKIALVVSLGITAALDLVFSARLKPGHIVGFLVGFIFAVGFVRETASVSHQVQSSSIQT